MDNKYFLKVFIQSKLVCIYLLLNMYYDTE